MSLNAQPNATKMQLFRRSLQFMDAAAGILVQRVPGSQLKRLLREDADDDDPVVHALRRLDQTFGSCKDKAVDMLSSVEMIAEEYAEDGAKSGAAVLLAWALDYDTQSRGHRPPALPQTRPIACG